jgi:hypothetical protein
VDGAATLREAVVALSSPGRTARKPLPDQRPRGILIEQAFEGRGRVTVTALPVREDPVALLPAVLDALTAQAPADLPGSVALDRARVLLAGAERLKTLALVALADVDTRELHALEGVATPAAWVAQQQVPGVDRQELTLARRLPNSPLVREALLAGELGSGSAVAVAGAVAKARPFLDRADGLIDGQPGEAALRAVLVDGVATLLAEQTGGGPEDDPGLGRLRAELEAVAGSPAAQLTRLEAGLVLLARRSAPRLLRGCLDLLLDALLPAQHDVRALRSESDAGLELSRDRQGSGWSVRGQLDDATGEMLATVLAAEQAVDPEAPADTTAWRGGASDPALRDLPPEQWPAERPQPRTRPARQHDALHRALRRLLDGGALGSRDKAAPHLTVTVEAGQLEQQPGAPGQGGARLPADPAAARSARLQRDADSAGDGRGSSRRRCQPHPTDGDRPGTAHRPHHLGRQVRHDRLRPRSRHRSPARPPPRGALQPDGADGSHRHGAPLRARPRPAPQTAAITPPPRRPLDRPRRLDQLGCDGLTPPHVTGLDGRGRGPSGVRVRRASATACGTRPTPPW